MIAFLHTSPSHIQRFTKIVRKYNTSIEIEHFVNENLLKTALETNKIDIAGFVKMVKQIQEKQADLIICTCSTYGEICENFTDVKRIDIPIANYLVTHFSKIILAYTVASTRMVSRQLLESVARKNEKKIEIIDCDCTDSWRHFLSNDMEKYYKGIYRKVNNNYNKGSVIFLAQASMEGVKKYFSGEDVDIFSSGEFGVKKYLETI